MQICTNLNNENSTSIAAKMHKYGCKNDITLAAKMHPSINNINNKTYCGDTTQTQNPDLKDLDSENELSDMKTKRKKVAQKKEKVEGLTRDPASSGIDKIPPLLDQVKTFFKIESFPELEAHKFFNHFQIANERLACCSPELDVELSEVCQSWQTQIHQSQHQ